eukprot:scaffold155273_cov35-Cyclotella_meneghiniana.AAC.2
MGETSSTEMATIRMNKPILSDSTQHQHPLRRHYSLSSESLYIMKLSKALAILSSLSVVPPIIAGFGASDFSFFGEGQCRDAHGKYYSFYKLGFDTNPVPETSCLDWCAQNPHPDLVGAQIFGSNCYCYFSGPLPSNLEMTDYDPPSVYKYSRPSTTGGEGAISKVHMSENWVAPYPKCYKNDYYGTTLSRARTIRPTQGRITPAPTHRPTPVTAAPTCLQSMHVQSPTNLQWECVSVVKGTGVSLVALSLNECKYSDIMTTETRRFLSEGNVVHYSDATQTVPRAEVVSAVEAALEGGQNFELQTNIGDYIDFQDLTRNHVVLSSSDLNGDFTITGPFVVDYPEDIYEVTCPANGNECHVAAVEPQFDGCVLKEEKIPNQCLDEYYDLNLYVIAGPHFMLGVSNEGKCPNVALTSVEGDKHKIMFSSAATDNIPSYSYDKKITLRQFLEAEEVAPAIDNDLYDLESNTCVHYAGSIWRELGYPETHELAQFIVTNIANDPHFEDLAKNSFGGGRYLMAKAVGGKRALESHLEEVVYSQMIITN